MTNICVAALQLPLGGDERDNIFAVSGLVAEAAEQGAQIILPPELFASPYFCKTEDEELFALAQPVSESTPVLAMQKLAKQYGVAIPASFFERDGPHHYNSLAMIGPDGEIMGVYRKSHIPDGPGYEEKYYFRPGNTGFRTWDLFGTRIGVGICWDQWYPESARAMALMGAEILFYPTAIGSEPYDADLDTSRMWRRAMQGHAVSNCMPVVASNRIGLEDEQAFYGHSFITNQWGDLIAEYGSDETGVLVTSFDLEEARTHRAGMGFFRDRRPELYGRLTEDK
tara:strand:+ start:1031 stop:1879 length:849 start_codon:yes stop_codon:yes gene_type:complete